MFKEMRKHKRQMTKEESCDVLKKGIDGVLGTISNNGYPHTVPLNYVYYKDKIYFHSAKEGLKIDNINSNEKVSFTVVSKNDVNSQLFTTDFQSVICYGKAKIIGESKEILLELIKKYSPAFLNEGKKYIDKAFMNTNIVEITIEHMTGKERK